ncbi:hypothetical protein WAI453_004958 [Rhynchosporium graminicola]
MGANLSNLTPVDTSKAVLSSGDFDTLAIRLPILWGCSIYVMFMIMSTCMLADRWRGPRGERRLSAASVLVAMLASAAWPLVLLYLLVIILRRQREQDYPSVLFFISTQPVSISHIQGSAFDSKAPLPGNAFVGCTSVSNHDSTRDF